MSDIIGDDEEEEEEEDAASLLAWMSAKNDAKLEEEEEEEDNDDENEELGMPRRRLPPTPARFSSLFSPPGNTDDKNNSTSLRKRAEVLTPPSATTSTSTSTATTTTTPGRGGGGISLEETARKIDEEYFATPRGEDASESAAKRLDGLKMEEETLYMRKNPRRAVASLSSSPFPSSSRDDKPLILPEAKPIGSYPMTDLERRTLALSADSEGKEDALERAIHRAMERAGTPVSASAPPAAMPAIVREGGRDSKQSGVFSSSSSNDDKNSRKLEELRVRDFRSLENVEEIREGAMRVKTWFRSLGVELNESVLVSARDDDENEVDTFARALTKAATDGSLLKEIVESESNVRIPSGVFAASSSITEGVLKHLRTVPGVKPRYLWCEDEIETGINVEATVGLFDDIRTCGRWD